MLAQCPRDVDTAAGFEEVYGWPGFDVLTFAHSSVQGPTADVHQSTAEIVGASAFPNPFTSKTQIRFSLQASSNVLLTVEDMLGRPVATVIQT